MVGPDSEGHTVPLSLLPPSSQGGKDHVYSLDGEIGEGGGTFSRQVCGHGISWVPPANLLVYYASSPFLLSLKYSLLFS